jgi:preprotein translocase subunit SecA
LLFGIPTQEDDFKRLFDEYSVPVSYKQRYLDSNAFLVYYSRGFDGVGRPSLEAGGEVGKYDDAVNQIQTVQYGSRNDVWVAWEAFQAEYSFFCSSFSSSSAAASMSVDEIENSTTEMIKYLKEALKAMNTYLELAPEEQLREALSRVAVLHDTSR